MDLQELFRTLCAQSPDKRQFVWITDIDEPTDGDFSGAIARAKCELEDKIRYRDGVYIGTTVSLAFQLQEFTLEQIDSEWEKVCQSIDSFQAIVSFA